MRHDHPVLGQYFGPDETSAEIQIERKVDFIIRELDELCKLATNAETVDLVQAQNIGVGQIVTRAQLVASFLSTRKLRIVTNG